MYFLGKFVISLLTKSFQKKQPKSDEQLYADWTEKYGQEAADMIQQTVKDNVETYEYLKQFAIKI